MNHIERFRCFYFYFDFIAQHSRFCRCLHSENKYRTTGKIYYYAKINERIFSVDYSVCSAFYIYSDRRRRRKKCAHIATISTRSTWINFNTKIKSFRKSERAKRKNCPIFCYSEHRRTHERRAPSLFGSRCTTQRRGRRNRMKEGFTD